MKFQSIDEILDLMGASGIELVSYGLAPNPNGFCFETCETTRPYQVELMVELLNKLSPEEENELRELIFG